MKLPRPKAPKTYQDYLMIAKITDIRINKKYGVPAHVKPPTPRTQEIEKSIRYYP